MQPAPAAAPTSVLPAAAAASVVASFLLFRIFDGGWGVLRALILLAIMLVTTWAWRRMPRAPAPPWLLALVTRHGVRLVMALLVVHVAIALVAMVEVARGKQMRMDQGQNTVRAARLLLRGENPYGFRVILDGVAFGERRERRERLGLAALSPDEERAQFDHYWRTLDDAARDRILPLDRATATPEARKEASLFGYKYGPALFLATAPLTTLFGPVGVQVLNLICFLLFLFFLWKLVAALEWPQPQRLAFMLMVLCETNLTNNSLFMTASDVCVLAPCALALWGLFARRPFIMALGLVLALGSKTFPSALFLPLLLRREARAAILPTVVGTALFYAPWMLWDFSGFVANVVQWPLSMVPDATSWRLHAPAELALVARFVAVLVAGLIALWLIRAATEGVPLGLAWLTALVLLSGAVLHNNYLPWLAWLVFLCWVQLCFPRREEPGLR